MPSIKDAVEQNSARIAAGQQIIEDQPVSGTYQEGPFVAPAVSPVTGLPIRGTYPPSITLHTDFQNNTQGFRTGPNMRSAMFPNPTSQNVTNVKVTTTTGSGGGSTPTSPLLLETNNMANGSQKILNLLNGTNISIVSDSMGNTTISDTSVAAGGEFAYGGDGSDGALVFDGSTNPVAGATLSGSTYTMTRDIFGTTIIVNNSVTILTANYCIFATISVTINGTIDNSGANASGANGGQHTTGVASAVGSLPLPAANTTGPGGGTGGIGSSTTNGNPGSAGVTGTAASNGILGQFNPSNWTAGNGGNSGANTGGAGSNEGSVGAYTATKFVPRIPDRMFGRDSSRTVYNTSNTCGGAGGGGAGAGDNTTAGGSGGAGGGGGGYGGFITICAPTITISGTISSNGGNGGTGGNGISPLSGSNPAGGGGGAGGPGGLGGLIMLIYHTLSNTGSITVNAGTGGSGGTHGTGRGSGANGTDGVSGPNGVVGLIVEILT